MLLLDLGQLFDSTLRELRAIRLVGRNSLFIELRILALVLIGFLEKVYGINRHTLFLGFQICLLFGLASIERFFLRLGHFLLGYFLLERNSSVED